MRSMQLPGADAGDAGGGPEPTGRPKIPPAWFKHTFWRAHRALYRVSRGRLLWTPSSKRGWGALRLTTIGRRSGRERSVIVGYLEDGRDLVVLAMNGWDEGHPSWWLNLEAHPDALVRLARQPARSVRAHRVEGEERERLWQRWLTVEPQLNRYAGLRSTVTPVIVLGTRLEERAEPEERLQADGGVRIDVSEALGEGGHEVEELGYQNVPDTGPVLERSGEVQPRDEDAERDRAANEFPPD